MLHKHAWAKVGKSNRNGKWVAVYQCTKCGAYSDVNSKGIHRDKRPNWGFGGAI